MDQVWILAAAWLPQAHATVPNPSKIRHRENCEGPVIERSLTSLG